MTYLIAYVLVQFSVTIVATVSAADWRSPRPPRWVKLLSLRRRRHAAAIRSLNASQGL